VLKGARLLRLHPLRDRARLRRLRRHVPQHRLRAYRLRLLLQPRRADRAWDARPTFRHRDS